MFIECLTNSDTYLALLKKLYHTFVHFQLTPKFIKTIATSLSFVCKLQSTYKHSTQMAIPMESQILFCKSQLFPLWKLVALQEVQGVYAVPGSEMGFHTQVSSPLKLSPLPRITHFFIVDCHLLCVCIC